MRSERPALSKPQARRRACPEHLDELDAGKPQLSTSSSQARVEWVIGKRGEVLTDFSPATAGLNPRGLGMNAKKRVALKARKKLRGRSYPRRSSSHFSAVIVTFPVTKSTNASNVFRASLTG